MDLLNQPLLVLFLILALGLILGRIRVAGLTLDVSAVIFVALVFGAFGYQVAPVFQQIGLVLFVFSVGLQSGPGFAASFRRQALTMLGPVLLLVALSVALMLGLSALFGLDPRLALGLLTGARSSNSALAVGVSTTGSNLPALGHSLAYPIGVLGALLFVRLLPRLFGADLKAEEARWQQKQLEAHPPLITRTYRVANPNLAGQPLKTLQLSKLTGVNLSRVLHEGTILVPTPATVLAEGDLVKAVGTAADLETVKVILGPETEAPEFAEMPLDRDHDARWIVLTNRRLVGKTLDEIQLGDRYAAAVTRIKRHEVELTPHPWSTLKFGDLLMLVGSKSRLGEVKEFLGGGRRSVEKDFLPLSLGLVLGLALGSVKIPAGGGLEFSLGMTGGVLITALALGAAGKTGPLLWHLHESSLKFVRQLGLLLFLAAVGTDAGGRLLTVLDSHGLAIAATALTISLVPLALVALLCRFVLKMDILTLMGLLSGGTTCSPALAVAANLSSSNAATLAYSTVYPFAMIFMMLVAQVLAVWPAGP